MKQNKKACYVKFYDRYVVWVFKYEVDLNQNKIVEFVWDGKYNKWSRSIESLKENAKYRVLNFKKYNRNVKFNSRHKSGESWMNVLAFLKNYFGIQVPVDMIDIRF